MKILKKIKEKYGFKQKHAMKYSTQKPIQKNFDWIKAVMESAAFAFAENTRIMRLNSIYARTMPLTVELSHCSPNHQTCPHQYHRVKHDYYRDQQLIWH